MKKQKINVWVILKDAIILFVVSTVLVIIADKGFGMLKDKGVKDDPLVAAIHQNKFKELKKLLSSGENSVAVVDGHGRTALMQASFVNYSSAKLLKEADQRRSEMVAALLEHGAKVNEVDKDGWSALMWAAWSGQPKVVSELLEAGADVDLVGHNGFTALSLAAMRGKSEIVKQLLDHGADVTVKTKKGQTALDLVIQQKEKYMDEDGERIERFTKTLKLLENHNSSPKSND